MIPAPGSVVRVGAFDMHYRQSGGGPAALLVHGFLGSGFSWRHQLPALAAAGFTALAPDLPGFGESGKDWARDHSHPAFADACARFLAALDPSPAHVIGHSMGGRVALWLALRHPDRVRTLTLVDPSVFGTTGGVVPRLPGAVPVLRWWLHRRWARSEHRFRRDLARFYGGAAAEELADDCWRRYRRAADRDALVAHVRDAGGKPVLPRMGEVRVPVHVIWGEADPVFPVKQAQGLVRALDGARLTIIPGAGHFPHELTPGPFNAAMVNWLLDTPHVSH